MQHRQQPPRPSRRQYKLARLITRWYLDNYFGTGVDVGVPAMFCDPARVGHFAIHPEDYRTGDPGALFGLLVTCTMFQRRQDAQIMRVLRGISFRDAKEMTSAETLLGLADRTPCEHVQRNDALLGECDLAKTPETRVGTCTRAPRVTCHLKRHTVLLKRYGHFGKVPTSAALMLRDQGVTNLSELRDAVFEEVEDPAERAIELEHRISKAWRVSEKISAMFLSAVCNPDLSGGAAPWADGLDWTRFVVVDSNVDLFLAGTGYEGIKTYWARREFILRLARRVPLSEMRPGLRAYNPRVVQQALYMFMSVSNRRASTTDCSNADPSQCGQCPTQLASTCPSQKRRGRT